MMWERSHRFDARALPLADRHYNRHRVGSPQFCPPGRPLVLLTPACDALWVSLLQRPEFTDHDWPGAWLCQTFRNESAARSSDLIRQAVAATRYLWGEPPAAGFVTFIDHRKVRRKRDPGRCFRRAGWRHVGFTRDRGLYVLHLAPAGFDAPVPPLGELALGVA
jgi:hypothetical protein